MTCEEDSILYAGFYLRKSQLFWYRVQKMRVGWNNSLSIPFGVSNGMTQGSVLLPILFSVYLDDLLEKLCVSGVGCYLGGCFAGALSYADDIVLLAPCASSLRCMLNICQSFASSHGLISIRGRLLFQRPRSDVIPNAR